ncbi:hypothetical protein Hanom_Chr00s062125g01785451 [Helianthus anomalus]
MTIQELVDEKNRLESQLHSISFREGRFLLEKNKAKDDLKRVTAKNKAKDDLKCVTANLC